MDEIEVKILEASHKDFEKKLFELGAKKVFDGELFAIFFDDKNNLIKSKKQVLRLRSEGDNIFMTFKSKISDDKVKICDEIEFEVSSFDDAKLFLEKLGYNEIKTSKKLRVSYHLNNVHFDFDTYLGKNSFVPEFLEIEAPSIDLIYKYAKMLGFDENDCKPWNTCDIEKYYLKVNKK